jgi:hypothetical protein
MNQNNKLELLCPELQVALKEMEDEYDIACRDAKNRRESIIKNETCIFEANIVCGSLIKKARDKKFATVKSLRNQWGNFFYDNPR